MSNPQDLIACPYFGLQPATEREAQYFFGREQEQNVIKNNLYGPSLTVLYGASGVGKSSLLLAAVTPQVRKPNQAVVVFRQYQDKDIAGGLKRAVLEAVREGSPSALDIDLSLPLDAFLLECNRVARRGIFLIFDQFESYFLHHPPSPATDQFEEQFARAVNRQDIDVHLLLALREDRLSNLDRFQRRVNAFQNMLRVEPMIPAAAEAAIRLPLDKYNESQPPGRAVNIEDSLVEALLLDVTKGRGDLGAQGSQTGGRVDTPSLQLALTKLWDAEMKAGSRVLRLATYEGLGRAERIIGNHLEQIMGYFSEPDRRLAAGMFRYLVTPAGVKVAHTAADLATYTGKPVAKVEAVLTRLCGPDVRILQMVAPLPGQPDAARYEIFHDVLGPAILEWQTRYRADEIKNEIRAEERAKRLRWAVAAMAVGLISLGGLTVWAFKQRDEAKRQSVKAEKRRSQAEESEKRALSVEESLKASLISEQDAKVEARKQADAANEAKLQAEQERNRANDAKDNAVKAQNSEKLAKIAAQASADVARRAENTAKTKQREAEVATQKAKDALALAKVKTEEAQTEAGKAKRAEAVARQAAEAEKKAKEEVVEANDATVAYIEQVKKIDKSVPFAEGVIRNPETQPLVNAVYTDDVIVTSNEKGNVLFWKTGEVKNPPARELPQKADEFMPDIPDEEKPRGTDLITVLSSDGKRATTAGINKVYVWEPVAADKQPASNARSRAGAKNDPPKGRLVHTLTMPAGKSLGNISSLAITASVEKKLLDEGVVKPRDLVAAGTDQGWVVVWNLKQCGEGPSGCVRVEWQPHKSIVNSIAFSPDGRFMATGSGRPLTDAEKAKAEENGCGSVDTGDTSAKVWQSWPTTTEVGKEPHPLKDLKDHRCRVNGVAFNNPDLGPPYNRKDKEGKAKQVLRVVTASDDGTARAWNVLRITGPENGADGGWKEIGTDVYTLNVYEAPRVRVWLLRQPLRKFFSYSLGLKDIKRIQVPVYSAAYSPVDHNVIVTAGEEGALRVWDVASSSTVRVIQGQYGVRNVAFSDDGRYVVSAGDDQTVRLWNVCKDPTSNAKRSVIANLTTDDALKNLEAYCAKRVKK